MMPPVHLVSYRIASTSSSVVQVLEWDCVLGKAVQKPVNRCTQRLTA